MNFGVIEAAIRRARIIIASVLLSLGTLSPAGANIVLNGGFEAGADSSWTTTNVIGDWVITEYAPGAHSGHYVAVTGCVVFVCVFNNFLTQDLATVPGQQYSLGFWAFVTPGIPNELRAYWAGDEVFSVSGLNETYTHYVIEGLAATSDITELRFSGRDAPGALFLDDVSVLPLNAVAEPSSWLLVVLMLGLLIGELRRRRRSPELSSPSRAHR
jgi:hypothetical protein